MGGLTLSARVGILSLGLLALAACQKAEPARMSSEPDSEIVLCPGDPRCGPENASASPPDTCQVNKAEIRLKCGPQNLPCPGAGCPTGKPGIPEQQCRISETFVIVRCPHAADTPPATDQSSPAEPSEAAPAPAGTAAP